MAKLTILVASLVALLALAQATSTTVTTTEAEEANPKQQQGCSKQIQRQQNLRDCQRYLRQQGRQGDVAMTNEGDVEMTNDLNPQQQQQQQLHQCCQQLQNLDEQCRCEGVREAVRRQKGKGKMQDEEMRKMLQKAQNLPSRCNLSPQQCQISQ